MKNKFIVCLKRKIWKQMLPFRLLMDLKLLLDSVQLLYSLLATGKDM